MQRLVLVCLASLAVAAAKPLPDGRKVAEAGKSATVAGTESGHADELVRQLSALEKEGTEVGKSFVRQSVSVDGHTQEKAQATEEVKDAKGNSLGKVTHSEKSEDGKEPEKHTEVELPKAEAKKAEEKPAAESQEEVPYPSEEDIVRYITSSRNRDELLQNLADLVGAHYISPEQADQVLDTVMEEGEDEEEEEEEEGDSEEAELAAVAEELAGEEDARARLYALVRHLYTQYLSGRDEAKELLARFSAALEEGAEEGTLSRSAQDGMLETMVEAMKSVDADIAEAHSAAEEKH